MTRAVPRAQTWLEEIANSASHWLGLAAAIAALSLYLHLRPPATAAAIVGVTIYAVTLTLLFSVSALYHIWPAGSAKRVLMKLDYCAIYLFIAGTYTPFLLGTLNGPWGWSLLAVVWTLAFVGIALCGAGRLTVRASTLLYLAMGWLIVIAAVPMIQLMPADGLYWLLAGGLTYTAGVAFYLLDNRFHFAHTIWHLFVIGGSACHFVAVTAYAMR